MFNSMAVAKAFAAGHQERSPWEQILEAQGFAHGGLAGRCRCSVQHASDAYHMRCINGCFGWLECQAIVRIPRFFTLSRWPWKCLP